MDGKSLHYGAVGAISGKLHLLLMCLFSTAMLMLQTFSQIMPVSQTSIMFSYPLSEVSSGHWHHKSHESRTTHSLFGNNPRNTVNIYTSTNARISLRGRNKSLFFFAFVWSHDLLQTTLGWMLAFDIQSRGQQIAFITTSAWRNTQPCDLWMINEAGWI